MRFKAVLVLIFWLLKSTLGANKTCNETQCKLIIDGNDPTSEFRAKSSEHGVRMVYLHLNFGNESYNPLQSYDRFLPSRWTWARGIDEPMLSFSYQYQVLSLGLLRNQVRSMKVVLSDEPQGCFANMTSSSKDTMVARTLLEKVIDDSNSPLHSEDVVCVSVVQRDMDWLTAMYYGNVEYRCCRKQQRGNGTVAQCDLPVEEDRWLSLFYHELTIGIIIAFLSWPVILLLLPESLFSSSDQQEQTQSTHQNSSLLEQKSCKDIPVDDPSPITCSYLITRCAKAFPKTSHFFKLFLLCYIICPLFGYIFFALNYIFLFEFLLEIEAKNAIQENVFFYYCFDVRRNLYCLIPLAIFFFMPGNLIYFKSRYMEIDKLKGELAESLQDLAKKIIDAKFIKSCMSKFKNNVDDKFYGPNKITKNLLEYLECRYKILYYFAATFVIVVYGLILLFTAVHGILCGAILLVVFLLTSLTYAVYYSPFVVLIKFIHNIIENVLKENLPGKSILCPWSHKNFKEEHLLTKISCFCKVVFAAWIIYFSLAVSMCSRFFIRMFGFVTMGLIINAQRTTPYVIFIYVLASNIITNYNNYQKRYKKVKKMIFKQYQKPVSFSNANDSHKTIPEALFWSVCNEHNVLPIQQETFCMLITVIIISSILLLALTTIIFFGEEYNFSPLISAAAVFLSGKIADLFLQRESLKGWSKIQKEEEIKKAVDEWISGNTKFEKKYEKAGAVVHWVVDNNANTKEQVL